MKLVMTLLVRDEEDVLREHLEYHLNAGVDLVIATDHRSQDGTTEILSSYARDDVLVVLREEGQFAQQGSWQTRMSRLAASEFGADWVIPSDADEFWWPRGSSLKAALRTIPPRYGVVRGILHNFVPQRDETGWFVERLTLRLSAHAPINDPATPFRPVVKVAHRGDPRVVVPAGAHDVFGVDGELLPCWYPFDILHFPFRSRQQSDRKYRKTWTGWERNVRGDLARAREASEQGRAGAMWDRIALGDGDVLRGLDAGSLANDLRLRDAFRRMSETGTPFAPDNGAGHPGAFGAAVFSEAEVVRRMRSIDEIVRRVSLLENGPADRAR